MLQVSGLSYVVGKTDITYKFLVRVGGQQWEVDKIYKDFQKLHSDLSSLYGSASLPQLTGTVYLRVLSDATGTKRLPKFEDYLTSILSTWKSAFKNPKYLEIPNPKGKPFPAILVETTLAQFFEVQENYEVDSDDDADEEDDGDGEEKIEVEDDESVIVIGVAGEGEGDENNGDDDYNEEENYRNDEDLEAHEDHNHEDGHQHHEEKTTNNNLGWNDDEEKEAASTSTPQKEKQDNNTTKKSSPNIGKSTSALAAAANAKPIQPKKQQKKAEDDFDVIDEKQDTFQAAHVLVQCRTMTGEVDVFVKDYVIHPSAYIEYNFLVTFCGYSWKVTKRFSQFASFHHDLLLQLKGTEFVNYIPPMDDVAFPSWRKCDPDVAETRSVWLTNFFKIIAPMMDDWFEAGYLTHFKIRRRQGEEEDELDSYSSNNWIKVAVNRLLFEWFNFADHIQEFNAISAEKVAKENEKLLPQFMQKNLENVRKEEERNQREKNLAYRRSFMEKLNESEFDDLVRIVSSFDDDRHCLALLEFFVKTGYYYPGKTRVERIQELESQKAILEKRRKEAAAVAGMNTNNNISTNPSSANFLNAAGMEKESSNNNQQQLQQQDSMTNVMNTPPGSSSNFNQHNNNNSFGNKPDAWGNSNNNNNSIVFNTTTSTKSSYFNNNHPTTSNAHYNNNHNNHTSSNFNSAPDQSMYFRTPSTSTSSNFHNHNNQNRHDDAENVTMDIFDRMQNSAIFGSNTSTNDFTSLVTSAVNAAKDQLRGRTRSNTIRTTTTGDNNNMATKNQQQYDRTKYSRACGLTSAQMAKVAEAIPFNDTRAAAIAVMSPLLLDMDDLKKIFDALIYDWESAEKTLIELITKKEAPENFKYTPPVAPPPSSISS